MMIAPWTKVAGLTLQPSCPNKCTYWVTDQLLAGEYPGRNGGDAEMREHIQQDLDCGISFWSI